MQIYRLNWARRTSWGWRNDWDDTVLQTQDSKLEPWRSEAEHATSRSRRLPTILNLYEWAGKKHFVSLKPDDLRISKQAALTIASGNTGQLVPMSTCTQVNSYPCQLVPLLDVNSYHYWCQLVPPLDVSSYPARQVSDNGTNLHLLPHNPCQLVPMSTRTHGNSYH